MTKKTIPADFEKALAELNSLVVQLETGKLTLEQSLLAFEQGIKLTRQCQQALTDAEQKVQILLEKNETLSLEPYKNPENE